MGKVRQALFSMLEARGVFWPATRVLDVFAGSGSLGFEALSRGAAFAGFIESSRKAAALITENAGKFGIAAGRYAVWGDEARAVLGKRCGEPFGVVFIDPPEGENLLTPALGAILRNGWLQEGGVINAELESRLKFAPEEAHPALSCIADRTYGQTRVVLWTL
jgi:16S rRNA (guanine966-N2)-methyltransferase